MPKLQDKNLSKAMGSRIQKMRLEAEFTQQSLADRCGCSKDTIQSIESGRKRPSYELIAAISDAVDAPIDYFVQDGKHLSTAYVLLEYEKRLRRLSTELQLQALNNLDSLVEIENVIESRTRDAVERERKGY